MNFGTGVRVFEPRLSEYLNYRYVTACLKLLIHMPYLRRIDVPVAK